MKSLVLFSLLTVPALQGNNEIPAIKSQVRTEQLQIPSQPETCYTPMSATVFKNQEYCRAEVPDFDFDAHFTVLKATVYFSGANFHVVEKGIILNASLKPLNNFMQRCIPGSIVVFDDVKVKGPDNEIRTIPGVSYKLY